MFGLETILGIIFEKIIEPVIQPVGRHAGFLLHYKRNLNNLEDEVNNLQEQRSDVEGKVNEANRQGDAIDKKVSVWLEDAEKTRQEVEELRNERTVKENMLCCSFSCPNFISRYRLSKEAERKVVRVKHLTEKGGNIGTVAHPRDDPPEVVFRSGGNYECFHSRDKVFKDIVKALKDPEVNMIGVYGTGGVGKTTMVTNVAEQVKKDGTFDEVVIAVASQDANVIKIQGQLAARLKLPLSGETDDEVGRASQLWHRLKNGMKNLIILDDVWHELDLKQIGIPISDGNKSCKVVLTARNRDVWKNMDVDKDFKIEILIEQESWALFQKKVENYVDDADQELREIAWAVCKECQGLPVAINAIGAALKNKDMYAWRDALDKLQNSMLNDIEGINRQVYASLKWSYDRLDSEDAKSCFLLCCLFPEDARIPIDDLVRYYMAGRTFHHDQKPDSLERALYRVRTVVSTLISCCLLLDENYSDDFVKMHDVVRDVAISIAKGEKYSFLVKHGVKDWPEKSTYAQCSVISLRPRDMREFPDELVCPALHTLRLDCTDDESQLQVPDRFFSGTENLMVLDLKSVTMSPILPASLAKLAKLQMLCLDGCKLGDIAILKDLKDHLEILSLRRSYIKVLPPEVGELTCLRVLDMDSCYHLDVIPKGVISKLFRLEELVMPQTFCQWEGKRADGTGRDISRVSLDELMSLTRLTTLLHVWIRDPALVPKDFTFENLVRFYIRVGKESYSIYDKDSTGVLQLEKIHVANGLESLLGKPKPKWSIQRDASTSFYHLTYLRIKDCRLKYLFSPSSARGLVQLKKLVIESCMDMEGVIGNEGEEYHEDIIPISFSRLNELSLEYLPNLKSFYPKKEKKATSGSESCSAHDAKTVLFTDKVILPVLKRLIISKMGNIIEIWDKQSIAVLEDKGSFCQLTDVSINYCNKLPLVFPSKMHPQLKNLEKLEVYGCVAMEGIVEFEGEIYEDGLGNEICFSKLSHLELKRLPNLVRFCTKLRTAGTTDGNTTIHAQPLFNEKVIFPVLERLTIRRVGNIIEILDNHSIAVWQEQGSFCQLMEMNVYECDKLMHVYPSNMHPLLRNLEKLDVQDCGIMKGVVRFEGQLGEDGLRNDPICFNKLTKLSLSNLPNLLSFCTESGTVPGTTNDDATIHGQSRVSIFNEKVILPVLKRLVILRMGNIIEIWDKQSIAVLEDKGSFCQLTDVSIKYCDKLLLVFPSKMHPQLKNLETLEVIRCAAMEGIVEFEGEIYEDGLGNEVCFSKLSSLELWRLPNLVRFCTKLRTAGTTDGNATIYAQPLFNEKVIFPVLEMLRIYELDNIIKIWDNQSMVVVEEQGSFCQLTKVEVNRCNKLMHVLSSKMHPLLKNLKELEVFFCGTMKSIIEFEGEIDEDGLRNEVASPALEHLDMFGAPKITVESLCKLERIEIVGCNQLLYVFPSNMLPQNLQRLRIRNCDMLEEVIFSKELKEKEAINYDIIVFPQLKEVRLWNLPKLKSFYTKTQGFFSHKVAFPVLENLSLVNLDKITRIWDNQPLSELEKEAKSFCQLMGFFVSRCVHLEYVLPFYMLPQLKNLQELTIRGCTKMEVIIISNNPKDQKEATINDTILFPQLKTVVLNELPNLKSLCTEAQLFFSNKDAFPVLKTITLEPKGTLKFL